MPLSDSISPCRYCGMPAGERDHVLSRRMRAALENIGMRDRYWYLPDTVPCCGECNRLARAKLFPTLAAKRRFIHKRLRERHHRLLASPNWTEAEIAALGESLQTFVRHQQARKELLKARLAWPSQRSYALLSASERYSTIEAVRERVTL